MKQNKKPEEFPEQIEYREAHKDLKDAELRIALRSRGIDPYELSQKDMDDIRRRVNKMQQIDASTKARMKAIEQEGNTEQQVISQEIEAIIARVYLEQNPNPVPPLHVEQPRAEQQASHEQTGQVEGSVVEPGKEPVDTGVQGD